MNRRTFLALGAAGVVGSARAVRAATRAQDDIPYGETRLGIAEDRDGSLYVPKSYRHGTPMPILVWLHGFSGSAGGFRSTQPLAEEFGAIVLAPESRGITWGQSAPGFDEDVRYIGAAFRDVGSRLDLDGDHVALGGVSDGATYALCMGVAYGDVFNHIMVFSEGALQPFRWRGQPRVFLGHGTRDIQMPIEQTSYRTVPALRERGIDVTLHEYDGGHGAPAPVVRAGFEWFFAR
jgi:phospholipase/carboxylesterase